MKNKASFFFLLLLFFQSSFSQKTDSIKAIRHIGGAVSVTNNGISFIPNFTLGKPAAIFDLSVGGNRLSFEPQFRFALEGTPWAFILWWRYKLVETDKLRIGLGAHPAFHFKTSTFLTDSISIEIIGVKRYLAGELSPNYLVTKNISIGLYYMYGHGIEKDAIRNTHFLALRSNFSNIKLTKQFFLRFNPQIYYLKMDKKDGFYFSSTLTLARINFPLSISSLINKNIQTEIPADKDFVWNVSLIYSFNKEYIER